MFNNSIGYGEGTSPPLSFNLPDLNLRAFGVPMVLPKTALFRKLKSLESVKPGKLAGKMGVVINLVTRLPVAIWFQENPSA